MKVRLKTYCKRVKRFHRDCDNINWHYPDSPLDCCMHCNGSLVEIKDNPTPKEILIGEIINEK